MSRKQCLYRAIALNVVAVQENLGGDLQSEEQVTLSWCPCFFLSLATCRFRTLWPIHLIEAGDKTSAL